MSTRGIDTDLRAAVEHAAAALPEGWIVAVEVSRDSGSVTLNDPDGELVEFATNYESLAQQVRDAVEEARRQAPGE